MTLTRRIYNKTPRCVFWEPQLSVSLHPPTVPKMYFCLFSFFKIVSRISPLRIELGSWNLVFRFCRGAKCAFRDFSYSPLYQLVSLLLIEKKHHRTVFFLFHKWIIRFFFILRKVDWKKNSENLLEHPAVFILQPLTLNYETHILFLTCLRHYFCLIWRASYSKVKLIVFHYWIISLYLLH